MEGQVAKEQIRTKWEITTVNAANKCLFAASLVLSIAAAKGITRVAESRSDVSMELTSFIGFRPSPIRELGVIFSRSIWPLTVEGMMRKEANGVPRGGCFY